MLHQFVEKNLQSIKEERESLERTLIDGGIKSMEDYRYVTGVIRGLDLCASIMEQRLQAYTEE
jgi:hypothetical protein